MAQAHMAAKYIGSRIPGAEFEIVEVKTSGATSAKIGLLKGTAERGFSQKK